MRAAFSDLQRPALNEAALRERLVGADRPLHRLDVVEATGSTNADLAAAVRAGSTEFPDRTLLVTEHQQAGRGRLGRAWITPARSALTMSLLLRPPAQTRSSWSWLSLICGLAVTDALRSHAGLSAAIKWPNDVLVPRPAQPGRPMDATPVLKVAGILGEVVTTATGETAVVIGVGLNVTITTAELGLETATSLAAAGAATTDRSVLLRAIVRRWIDLDQRWRAADGDAHACGIADEIREHCVTIGQTVRVSLPAGEPLVGSADGIDRDGRLLVHVAGRTVPVAAGDVEHVRSVQ